ncbi:hypothetical protein M0805_008153 [Coniferiporia weirii]|nr:hypothetical protein M0805_008153 [Coniferiporia weirii]
MQVYGPSDPARRYKSSAPTGAPYPRHSDSTNPSRSISPFALRSRQASASFDATRPHTRKLYTPASPPEARAVEKSRSSLNYPALAQKPMSRPPLIPGTSAYAGKDGRVLLDMESFRRNLGERVLPQASHDPHTAALYAAGNSQGQRTRQPQSGQAYNPVYPQPLVQPSGWPSATGHPSQAAAGPNLSRPAGQTGRTVVAPSYAPQAQNMYAAGSRAAPSQAPVTTAKDGHSQYWNSRGTVPCMFRPPYYPPYDQLPHTYFSSYLIARPPKQEDYSADPLIHNALGWWPDQPSPSLVWDLSSLHRPRYSKREFDADELAASPFTPPRARMRLVLSHELGWSFEIAARPGERHITLRGLLEDISALMRTPRVPHAFWTRASREKKKEILRAMFTRTGKTLPVVPPHRRPKTMGQLMEEAVVEGARPGYTNLLVVDLLCADVMFWGMEFHKEPDEWFLRTTSQK